MPLTGTARSPTFSELSGFLWELQYIAGFQIWRSMSKDESAALVSQACRLEWKSWKEHDALGVDGIVGAKVEKVTPSTPSGGPRFMTPGKCWRMAAQIDGLGGLASYTQHGFDTPYEMVTASVESWEAVLPAKQKWRAREIHKWLRER